MEDDKLKVKKFYNNILLMTDSVINILDSALILARNQEVPKELAKKYKKKIDKIQKNVSHEFEKISLHYINKEITQDLYDSLKPVKQLHEIKSKIKELRKLNMNI